MMAKWCRVSFASDGNVLILIVVRVVHICEYSKEL